MPSVLSSYQFRNASFSISCESIILPTSSSGVGVGDGGGVVDGGGIGEGGGDGRGERRRRSTPLAIGH